jgi:hypothetical protein
LPRKEKQVNPAKIWTPEAMVAACLNAALRERHLAWPFYSIIPVYLPTSDGRVFIRSWQ